MGCSTSHENNSNPDNFKNSNPKKMPAFQLGRPFTVLPSNGQPHTATVIFLHGLGDSGEGWSQSMEDLKLNHVKFLCPSAPVQPVSLNGGHQMPSWFDIRGLDPSSPEDADGIIKASTAIKTLIEAEIANGIPKERIVIGGFSQGGAAAIFTALTMDVDVAGVVCLSTWLPLNGRFPGEAKSNLNTPIFQCHGTADPIVPFQWGKKTAAILKAMTTKHEFMEYSGLGHSSSASELRDLKEFLERVIPPQ